MLVRSKGTLTVIHSQLGPTCVHAHIHTHIRAHAHTHMRSYIDACITHICKTTVPHKAHAPPSPLQPPVPPPSLVSHPQFPPPPPPPPVAAATPTPIAAPAATSSNAKPSSAKGLPIQVITDAQVGQRDIVQPYKCRSTHWPEIAGHLSEHRNQSATLLPAFAECIDFMRYKLFGAQTSWKYPCMHSQDCLHLQSWDICSSCATA